METKPLAAKNTRPSQEIVFPSTNIQQKEEAKANARDSNH